jgi:hypothetical protein
VHRLVVRLHRGVLGNAGGVQVEYMDVMEGAKSTLGSPEWYKIVYL